MNENPVIFKGTVNGLTIILKQDATYDEVLENMKYKISTAGRFFKGATLAVRYKGRVLSEAERTELYNLLVQESGAEITSFEEDPEPPGGAAAAGEDRTEMNKIKKYMYFNGIEEGNTKFYRGTVRSGQRISFEGNLVVLGDVNPGAIIEATGNVVVMGLLRGVVHAGSDGNKEAIVAALGLNPTQLRIADIITRSPDEKGAALNFTPELAYVKNDTLYVERFLPQR